MTTQSQGRKTDLILEWGTETTSHLLRQTVRVAVDGGTEINYSLLGSHSEAGFILFVKLPLT